MQKKPHLCFVGNMLGRNAGYITTQGQITADLFASENYPVTCVSSKINRIARLSEIVTVLIKNRRRLDLVLLEVYGGLGFLIADVAGLLCKIFNLPFVMVLHGGGLPDLFRKKPRWATRVLRRADRLVAPSAFLAEKIGSFGFDVKVISNVIDLSLTPFRERSRISPRLIWMRSFHQIYHPQMAIRVLKELRKSYPNATLTMAGTDKGAEAEVKQLAKDLNLSEAVIFPGFLDAEKKRLEFSRADIYLNTNRIDNMPVSVLEACAFGLPVVATDVGGLPYLIDDGENGLLVENENVDAMVDAIKALLCDPDLTRKISRGARRLAENSGWEKVRAAWERLFAEIFAHGVEARFPANDLTADKQKI